VVCSSPSPPELLISGPTVTRPNIYVFHDFYEFSNGVSSLTALESSPFIPLLHSTSSPCDLCQKKDNVAGKSHHSVITPSLVNRIFKQSKESVGNYGREGSAAAGKRRGGSICGTSFCGINIDFIYYRNKVWSSSVM
jgi:hypothetical protein